MQPHDIRRRNVASRALLLATYARYAPARLRDECVLATSVDFEFVYGKNANENKKKSGSVGVRDRHSARRFTWTQIGARARVRGRLVARDLFTSAAACAGGNLIEKVSPCVATAAAANSIWQAQLTIEFVRGRTRCWMQRARAGARWAP